jgi:Transketolase, thiamine diphosphate binding domain
VWARTTVRSVRVEAVDVCPSTYSHFFARTSSGKKDLCAIFGNPIEQKKCWLCPYRHTRRYLLLGSHIYCKIPRRYHFALCSLARSWIPSLRLTSSLFSSSQTNRAFLESNRRLGPNLQSCSSSSTSNSASIFTMSTSIPKDLEQRCVNTIRAVSADQPQAANSGHPGAPMGCAPMAHVLWTDAMTYSASDPAWINRDRFVLSNGHACALQYTMLHLTGYDVTVKDLAAFRSLGSKTPGHPECFVTAGTCVLMLLVYFLSSCTEIRPILWFSSCLRVHQSENRCGSVHWTLGTRNLECGGIGHCGTSHGRDVQRARHQVR